MGLFSSGSKGIPPQLAEVIEASRKRLKADPGDVGAALRLADALVAASHRLDAVRLLNRVGPIVQSRGRLEDAIAVFKKASQIDPEFELTSTTYLSHIQLQKLLDLEKQARASAPPVAGPPLSAFLPKPGSG